MKPKYKRKNLEFTEFDTEDVIAALGASGMDDMDNVYYSLGSFSGAPGSWF